MSSPFSSIIAAGLLFVALLSSAPGCSGLQRHLAAEKSPGHARLERKADIVKSFETRRAQAQYEAALARASHGDLAGSEQMLQTLVSRQPGFVDARLKLAELLCLREDLPAAEAELQAAVANAPDRADVHHALGILLASLERQDEARQHLMTAAELEPANELYALAL